ncbi:MAG: septum formation initiator family protein [Patescibacteria group bacterium]
MIKKLILILLPLILAVIFLSNRLVFWYQAKQEVAQMEQEVVSLKEATYQLKQKQEYYQSQEYLEKEARDKLAMTNPEDLLFVVPETPDLSWWQKGKVYSNSEPWQQWWQLFFGE